MEVLNGVAACLAIFSSALLAKGWFETWALHDLDVERLTKMPKSKFDLVAWGPAKADAYRIRWWIRLRRPLTLIAAVSLPTFAVTLLVGW